ncbi:MAG: hypothetical protein INQ03_21955 [Candidatus Heimdallarchaeota archaeon]|nr:hypothetical protein [Candidatus Heimdallarchaeota archaeon]
MEDDLEKRLLQKNSRLSKFIVFYIILLYLSIIMIEDIPKFFLVFYLLLAFLLFYLYSLLDISRMQLLKNTKKILQDLYSIDLSVETNYSRTIMIRSPTNNQYLKNQLQKENEILISASKFNCLIYITSELIFREISTESIWETDLSGANLYFHDPSIISNPDRNREYFRKYINDLHINYAKIDNGFISLSVRLDNSTTSEILSDLIFDFIKFGQEDYSSM